MARPPTLLPSGRYSSGSVWFAASGNTLVLPAGTLTYKAPQRLRRQGKQAMLERMMLLMLSPFSGPGPFDTEHTVWYLLTYSLRAFS